MATNRVSPKKGKVVDIPTVPTVGTATAGAESATVTYTAATKGGPATTFTALSNPGSITGTGTSPITVSGLTAGTAYTFTVRGSNATGSGEYSSASNSVTPTVLTSFESIATVTLNSTQATVNFTSIPSTYKHLQIRYIARNSAANTDGYQAIQFNGDSTNGNYYFYHFIEGVGTSVSVSSGGTNAGILAGRNSGASATSGVFGAGVIDILDYTNTNKNTVVRVLTGSDNNGSGNVLDLSSGFWLNTAAVTSISLLAGLGGYSFVSGTQFALYGIKG
jgi:hypothetical protein